MKRNLSFIACLVLLCIACTSSEGAYVAVVNNEKITLAEFKKRLSQEVRLGKEDLSLKSAQWDQLKEEVLNILIGEEIMRQRAKALAISVSEEELSGRIADIRKDYRQGGFDQNFTPGKMSFANWKESLRQRLLREKLVALDVNERIAVTGDEAKAYHKEHGQDDTPGKRVHVLQIVVRESRKVEKILKRLNKGEDFAKVAREQSLGPEAAKGGDLGFFGPGVMPEEIDAVVFSLPEGKISRVVASPYGYHIFKIIEKSSGDKKQFSEMKDQIMAEIRKQKEQVAYGQWLTRLRAAAIIKINADMIKETPVP